MFRKSTSYLARTALFAALYFVLGSFLTPLNFGPWQFRLSEAMTYFPVLFAESVPGLTIGCFLMNLIFSPYKLYDAVIGTSATLIAALMTRLMRKKIAFAGLPPVILNALAVPLVFILAGQEGATAGYFFNVFSILISEAVVVYAAGLPLTISIKKIFPALSPIDK